MTVGWQRSPLAQHLLTITTITTSTTPRIVIFAVLLSPPEREEFRQEFRSEVVERTPLCLVVNHSLEW